MSGDCTAMPYWLTAREWGARQIPPISAQRVRLLIRLGRLPQSVRFSGAWAIPASTPDPRLPTGIHTNTRRAPCADQRR